MNTFYLILVVALVLSFSGCSRHNLKKADVQDVFSPLSEGRVLQKEKFSKGGNLRIIGFIAGEGVVANDDLDQVSQQIIRGISDTLELKGPALKILPENSSENADLLIKGRILQMEEKRGLKPWPKRTRVRTLSIEGTLLTANDDESVAKFAQSKRSADPEDNLQFLGYKFGVEIGRFLATGAQ